MSQSTEATRRDPLLDAYRQASAREGARAGGNLRATVLAHARVVAQWSPDAVAATGLSALPEATRATPAATEQRPIWRLAAGVVIGLIGVWIFQLTRPSAAPDTTVAAADVADVVPAAQADKARAAVPAGAALPRVPSPVTAASPEASVAVAAARVATDSAQKPANATRARPAEAGLPERTPAMANAPALRELPDRPPVFAGATVPAAPVAAQAAAPASPPSSSTADASTAAMAEELVIASAEVRKPAKVQSRPEASTAAAANPAPSAAPARAAPNAFPAQASEAASAAAPAPRPVATAAVPSRAGASRAVVARGVSETPETAPAVASASRSQRPAQLGDAASRGRLSEPELAMFTAVRAGDVAALRIAITRGANVNSKDEGGRTPLQIARERADSETIRTLDAAGAR